MKKILVVHPNNFLKGDQGENARTLELVRIFNEIGYKVDHLGYSNFHIPNDFVNHQKQNTENLVNELFLYDYGNAPGSRSPIALLKKIGRGVHRRIKSIKTKRYLQDWAPEAAKRYFRKITTENNYDAIVLFYTYLTNLLEDANLSAKKVYSMEDCIFLQQHTWGLGDTGNTTLGRLMDEELELLKNFDEIFCISHDEKLMYEKFTGKTMHFVPHLQPSGVTKSSIPINERKWDVMYVGAGNPYNIEGINWFAREVYPLLNKNLRMVFIGSVLGALDVRHSNIDLIHFAPSLNEMYNNSKITICPMFRGTGMKIKVVESMARGLPVVCNDRGVDGMPDKTKSGCLVSQDAQGFAGHINRLLNDSSFYNETVKNIEDYYGHIFSRNIYIELLKKILQ